MVRLNDFVAIFHSVHKVMRAEKILKKEKVEMLLIPVPRQLTSDCGLAIRFADKDRDQIESILSRENLSPEELFMKSTDGYQAVDVKA